MKYTYQYRIYPEINQKLTLNNWLRICRYWYNRMLGERFNWWEQNRCPINACPLISHLPELKDKPNYYNQKKQLPELKKGIVEVKHSGEHLDFSQVYSTVLQDVCKRVEATFSRFVAGDSKGNRSGKPRFKSQSRYRSLNFPNADDSWLKFSSINSKWLYLSIPKIGLFRVITHRPIPDGSKIKQVSLINKADGWWINFSLEDKSIPELKTDNIQPNWENSVGLDAVLDKDIYLATSEGNKLPSLKPLRTNQDQLTKVSQRKNKRKHGSKSRRKLAKREGKIHQKIARNRKNFQYKTAYKLTRTGKKVFFIEKLNLVGLTRRNKTKQDENGNYSPNGQSSKSGLNKSWLDAAFNQFFQILGQVAEKANARVIECKPNYISQLLCYRDEIVFTDCNIREYFDEELQLKIDRDINAAINLKRVGLDLFPTINRRQNKVVIAKSKTASVSKEVLTVFKRHQKPTQKADASV
ncbi:MAG: transposase [Cyanobacteria bacterium P01_H01_bin.35]